MNDKRFLNKRKSSTGGKFVFLAAIIVIIDQYTKFLAEEYVQNTGILFGMFQNSNQIMIYVSAVAAAILIGVVMFSKLKYKFFYALILGGVIGNLTDRLMKGFVVDWINFLFIPTFNVADAAISVSVVLLILFNLLEDKMEKGKLRNIEHHIRKHYKKQSKPL